MYVQTNQIPIYIIKTGKMYTRFHLTKALMQMFNLHTNSRLQNKLLTAYNQRNITLFLRF